MLVVVAVNLNDVRFRLRGDGSWFVEVLCQHGLIYPHGSTTLSCYVKGQVRVAMAELLGAEPYQRDHKALMLRFDVADLDEAAAILKPKRLRGSAVLTAEQRENVSRHAFAATRHAKSRRSRSRSTPG
jgi:hypothetical protein